MPKNVHMVGIGGIGVSAVARLFRHAGAMVTGSDASPSPVTIALENEGISVAIGHNRDNVPIAADLLVYSPAVVYENVERMVARERNIKELSYPEALGMVSFGKYTIAVSGTHGKTTTTAMLAQVLASLSPTTIVGSIINGRKTNFIAGDSKYFIVEACEYRRSFLALSPNIAVITNIDLDHLDYYQDIADIQKAFGEFAASVPKDGYVVCNPNDVKVQPILRGLTATIVDYTKMMPEARRIPLQLLGEHNILNAAVALTVALTMGVRSEVAVSALSSFGGTWRRLEEKGKTTGGAIVYDDYGHTPAEIRATLAALRAKYENERLTICFQPHLYSRTKILLDDFVTAFTDADDVIVTDIYASREDPDPSIDSTILAERIAAYKNVLYVPKPDLEEVLKKRAEEGGVILLAGAGDIYQLTPALLPS